MSKIQFIGFVKGIPTLEGSQNGGLDFLIGAIRFGGDLYAHFRLNDFPFSKYLVRGVYESAINHKILIDTYRMALGDYSDSITDIAMGHALKHLNRAEHLGENITIREVGTDPLVYAGYDQDNGYIMAYTTFDTNLWKLRTDLHDGLRTD